MKLYIAAFLLWVLAFGTFAVLLAHFGWVLFISFALGTWGNQLGTYWSNPFFAKLRERRMRSIVARLVKSGR